jgi:hypothetical protein
MGWFEKKIPVEEYNGLPDDLDDFSCKNWVDYLDFLISDFPLEKAHEIWVAERHREYDDPTGLTPPDCSLSCSFNRELARRGLRSEWADPSCDLEAVWGELVETTQDITEATGDIAKGVGNLGRNLGSPFVWLGIGAVAYFAAKNLGYFD